MIDKLNDTAFVFVQERRGKTGKGWETARERDSNAVSA